ncbi:MAG: C40 family peptidase [Candidatus Aminicenantales bacterium]
MNDVVRWIAFLLSFSLPAAAGETPRSAVITRSVADMHGSASAEAELVSQAILGTPVRIIAAETNALGEKWFRIETPDAYEGWTAGEAVRILGEGSKPYASEGQVFEVTSLFANIYATESVSEHKPLTVAVIGARLEAGECGERWCRIVLPSGTPAWIHQTDGEIKNAAAPRKRLSPDETVALAERFLGLPYLWGGRSSFGFDCSGFVQTVYLLSGFELPRDSGLQMAAGGLIEVPAGAERTRDLVFFGKKGEPVSHVGMMIGPKEFIQAAPRGRPVVQIASLDDPYWREIYRGARRPKD